MPSELLPSGLDKPTQKARIHALGTYNYAYLFIMLHVKQLTKHFGSSEVVHCLDLSVERGQIRGLLGPNGAGKSTTIRMICGVMTPDFGTIQIDGIDIANNPTLAKQSIGYLPEGAPLPEEFLPSEYLKYVASMYGLFGDEQMDAINSCAEQCDIKDVLEKPIAILSRGYRQRVALAAAIMHKPKVLVLDEPSTGLDPEQSASFRKLVRATAETSAVLYSSHHLSEVEETCDVVSIISNGRVVLDSTFEDLREDGFRVVVEVSPHSMAEKISGTNPVPINGDWIRCELDVSNKSLEVVGEDISQQISNAGGKIRLLHPISNSLESTYLRYIHEAEAKE